MAQDEMSEAAARLRMVVRVLNRRAQAETGPGSPTRSQQAVLAWLEERGAMGLNALAVAEGVRQQSMSELVDILVKRGWVTREAAPGDRRRVVVSLTGAGAEALDRGRRLRQAWLTEAMRTELDAAEQATLVAGIGLLERIVASQAGAAEDASIPAADGGGDL